MIDRRTLLTAGVAAGALLVSGRFGEAETMTTTEQVIDFKKLTDAEWRKRLTPTQYDVLRKHGTERAGTSPLNKEHRKGTFACAGCDLPLFFLGHQVRQRHRLAELLSAAAERGRRDDRPVVLHDAHRGALQSLRRSSRPCVQRRPETDGSALLHERRGDEIRARRGVLKLSHSGGANPQPATCCPVNLEPGKYRPDGSAGSIGRLMP